MPKTPVESKTPERSLIISYVTLNARDNQTIFRTVKPKETEIELSSEKYEAVMSVRKTKHNEFVFELHFDPTEPSIKQTTPESVGNAIRTVNRVVEKPLDLRIYLPLCWRNLIGLMSLLRDALDFGSRLEKISLATIRSRK